MPLSRANLTNTNEGEKMKTEKLACTLTEEERVERGEKLAAACRAEEKLVEEKAAFNERHKMRATIAAFERSELTAVVETGIEYREVEVEEHPDYKRGTVAILRIDTMALVRERPMSEEERQSPLFTAEGKAKKSRKIEAAPADS